MLRPDHKQELIDQLEQALIICESNWQERTGGLNDELVALEQQLAEATYRLNVLEPELTACRARADHAEQERDAWHRDASSHLAALCEKQAEVNALQARVQGLEWSKARWLRALADSEAALAALAPPPEAQP